MPGRYYRKLIARRKRQAIRLILWFVLFIPAACNNPYVGGTKENSRTDWFNEVDSLNAQAGFYRNRNVDSAFLYANKALKLSQQYAYQKGEALSKAKISRLFRQLGQYDTALVVTQQSHTLREKIGDQKLLAASFIHFANLYLAVEQYDKAKENILKSLELSSSNGDSSGIFNAYNQMGILYGHTGQQEMSKLSFLKTYQIAQLTNNHRNVIKAQGNLGIAYKKLGLYDSAYFYYMKNFDYFKSEGLVNNLAGVKTNLANVLIKLGRNKQGLKMLKSAYNEALKLENQPFISTSLSSIQTYYYDRRQFDSAHKYMELYSDHKSKTYKTALAEGIATAQVKYETEKVELENEYSKVQIKKDSKIKLILQIALGIILLVAFLILRAVQQKRRLAEKETQLQKQKVDKLLGDHEMKTFEAMVHVQEEERKRIAEDLHDRLGSILAAVKLHFTTIEEQAKKLELESIGQYHKANEMLDVAAQEVRSISHDMLSNVLVKFGLVAALNDLCDTIQSSGQIEMEVFEHGLKQRLDNSVEIAVYRIVQELISNILKHAQAKKIILELNVQAQRLNIIVSDDGIGFKTNKNMSFGVGLDNIQKRLLSINGEMTIDSKPNQGTSTIIDIDLNSEHD
jgi:two-component system, NarL family, sensor kinase